MSLQQIAENLKNGTASSATLVEAAFEIADTSAASNVFTVRFDHQAMASAVSADRLRKQGGDIPYAGVPITIKDNFDMVGQPTWAGSVALDMAEPAEADAAVVARLKKAGFIILGKTNMSEFAFSGLGVNPHFGTPINPCFKGDKRIPGGSSSGAAVSVALGMVPAAIGTDTGGSIRIPAALTGLVGFKPTASEISREGVLPLSTSLDAVGIIARSVDDCRAVFSILREGENHNIPSGSVRSLAGQKFAVVQNYVTADMDDDVTEAFEGAIRSFEKAGAEITYLNVPELDQIPEMNSRGTFPAREAFFWHRNLINRAGHRYDPRVRVRIEAGARVTDDDYARLTDRRQELIAAVTKRLAGFDAALMPTVPVIAPTVKELRDDEAYHHANLLMLRNPTVVNLLDGCAISIPCQRGMAPPVGFSLVGMRGEDDKLLALASLASATLGT